MFYVKDSQSERFWLVYNPALSTLMKQLHVKTTSWGDKNEHHEMKTSAYLKASSKFSKMVSYHFKIVQTM